MLKMNSLPVKLAESHFTAASNELHIFSSGLPYITAEDQQQLQIVLQELAALENSVWQSRQNFEVINITTSSLRHRLRNLKDNLSSEVSVAVVEVRDANQDLQTSLKEELHSIMKEIEGYKTTEELIRIHSDLLRHENTALLQKFKKAELNLNKKLSEKATYLHFLSETKEKIHGLTQETARLEKGAADLKIDLTVKRQQASAEEKHIKAEMECVLEEMAESERDLIAKKSEALDLKEELNICNDEIESKRKHLQKLKQSEEELKQEEQMLKKQSLSLKSAILSLKHEGQALKADQLRSAKQFKVELQQLSEQISKIKCELDSEKDKKLQLVGKKELLDKELKDSESNLQVQMDNLKDAQARLRSVKDLLLFRSEDTVRMSKDVQDMEKKLSQLSDSHRATLEVFKNQMENLRVRLTHDKRDRQDSQQSYDTFRKKAESDKAKNNQILQELSLKLNDTKRRNEVLAQKEAKCVDELSYLKGKSEHCQVELVTVTTEYSELIEQYEVQKRQIEEDHSHWKASLARAKAQLMLLQPEHRNLCEIAADKEDQYKDQQKRTIERKNQESDIRKGMKQKQQTLEDKLYQKKVLQKTLAQSRARFSSNVRLWAKETEVYRKDISEATKKLLVISHENEWLTQKIVALDREGEQLRKMRSNSTNTCGNHEAKPSLTLKCKDAQNPGSSLLSTEKMNGNKEDLLQRISELTEKFSEHAQWISKIHEEKLKIPIFTTMSIID